VIDLRTCLLCICGMIRHACAHTRDGRDAFFADRMTQDAVIWNLDVISQAVRDLGQPVWAANPHVAWERLAGLHDHLLPEYYNVDLNAVWGVVEQDLPKLRNTIESLLRELSAPPDFVVMTTEEEAFLQAVINRPDDDLPRLVYADWLDERGDPRGEFIRVQVDLSRGAVEERHGATLGERERDLLFRHRSAWLGRLSGNWRGDAVFDRGFVVHVTVSAREFLRGVDLWLRYEPIRKVALYGAAECMPELANCPALARLTALGLGHNELEHDHIEQLIRSPYLSQLVELDLCYNRNLGPASGSLVANAPTLSRLQEVHFDGNDNIYDVDAADVARVRGTKGLYWTKVLRRFS